MSATPPTAPPTALATPEMSAFLPPVNRAMLTLDRAFFKKAIPLAAAHIFDSKNITRFQKECAKDVLRLPRTKTLVTEVDANGQERKLLLLRPGVKADGESCVVARMGRAQLTPRRRPINSERKDAGVCYRKDCRAAAIHAPHDLRELELLYSSPPTPTSSQANTTDEIMSAILPEAMISEVPQSFAQAGHLAHLNLRSQYSPYKYLIATVIIDKNPRVTTVINKIEDVGTESEFRTFPMEVLAGPPNTEVEVNESGCRFQFDFAKVYWNTRLGDEHERVWQQFKPGEAVADVMAGVGPFAVPAGKKKVLVWANDLNPESYKSMKTNIKLNKVDPFVTPSCLDGREFIRSSIRTLYTLSQSPVSSTITIPAPPPRSRLSGSAPPPGPPTVITLPPTFSHFVMNLPATATRFLDAFRGVYRGLEHLFEGENARPLPLVHVYTFHKSPYPENAPGDICRDISEHLGYEMTPEKLVNLEYVRVVSPNKGYYCVEFRLPREVAFADVEGEGKAETQE